MKIQNILIVIIILVFTSCGMCTTSYDYAINAVETELPTYQKMFPSQNETPYHFSTVLFAQDINNSKPNDYSKFRVVLYHMRSPTIGNLHKGKYLSQIVFFNFPSDEYKKVDFDTIKLTHKNTKGEVLIAEESYNNLKFNANNGGVGRPAYRKVYDYKSLPDKLIEHVYLELIIDGISKKIEYEFQVEKAKNCYKWIF